MPSLNTKLASAPNTSSNYVLKATSSTTIGNSLIYDDGTNVLINTTTPIWAASGRGDLEINGTSSAILGFDVAGAGAGYLFHAGTDMSLYNGKTGYLRFGTDSTERMRITSTGNVGIGSTNPTARLDISSASGDANLFLGSPTGSGSFIKLFNNSIGKWFIGTNATGSPDNDLAIYGYGGQNGNIISYTNGTERMRITSGGNLLFTQGVSTGVTDTRFLMIAQGTTSSTYAMVVKQSNNSTNLFVLRDDGLIQTGTASGSPYNNTSGAAANVVVNSAGTLERATSSLKYKKEITDYDKGLAEVIAMRPVYYKGKNPNDGDKQFAGLIAEEIHDLGLTEFVTYAEDGSPDALAYQNMVALLVKGMQEQQSIIDGLNQRLNALENK